MRALVLVAALAATAAAHPAPPPDVVDEAEPDPITLLGLRLGIGALPVDGSSHTTISFGLGVEHPVWRHWRALGEYEWLWLGQPAEMTTRPAEYGSGHRLSLGVRHAFAEKQQGSLRLFADGELGGGMALVTDNLVGLRVMPHAFAGLRFGYDLRADPEVSPSRTFEAELLLRVIAIEHGAGLMVGVGMLWGN